MTFETAAEREALTAAWGDVAISDTGAAVRGQYDEPTAEALLVEGAAPTFLASLAEFRAAGVTKGSTIASLSTFSGETRGPFTVISWERTQDGNFILVGLQQS